MLVNRTFTPIDYRSIKEEFGLYQTMADFDQLYHCSATPPILVNQLDVSTIDRKDELRNLLVTTYQGTHLPLLPRCDCSDGLEGYQYLGKTCDVCGTTVAPATETAITSNVWITCPTLPSHGIHVEKLINPLLWNILDAALTVKAGKNPVSGVLEWITDPLARIENTDLMVFEKLRTHVYSDGTPFKRGLNLFYRYFDELIHFLVVECGVVRQTDRANLMEFIRLHRDKLFCTYIPLPHRITAVVEQANGSAFSQEHPTKNSYDAALSIASIYNSPEVPSQAKVEHHCVQAVQTLAAYYTLQISAHLSKKTGWNRKHGVGSRQDFSFRCVISSITGVHNHEEVWLPWSLAVKLFAVHLANRFYDGGMNPMEVEKRIQLGMQQYDHEIHTMLNELIENADEMGPAVIIQRNPTLSRQSAQLMQITKVKTDISDITMSISSLCLVGLNADKHDNDVRSVSHVPT